jgi:hypothetical protein
LQDADIADNEPLPSIATSQAESFAAQDIHSQHAEVYPSHVVEELDEPSSHILQLDPDEERQLLV